ncbi:leiomodin-1 [Hypomesus transpacificus]|uniref:leiomodin-1 n=1 Tax=Hypomesus transpacificus TaxID=137520 RepID=UPI001F07A2A1|nr:leiomodin-1 [Hypomesus transpacificus]
MSRRKVRGLTRTGRQVSEDPDLDNLLSNLSPEEMEELEKEVMTVPDLDPGEGRIQVLGAEAHEKAPPAANNIQDASSSREREIKKPSQRESCSEEPKKESRKQEYLRKMGLSQEAQEGPLQRQATVSSDQDTRPGGRTSTRPDGVKENRPGASSSYRRSDSRVETTDKQEDVKMKERRENRESMNNKTKDMISKLQGKNDEAREKERKEESKKRDDSKTKELISKLQQSKDGKKDRKEDFKTKGLVSKMLERQSQVEECKAENKKTKEEEKDQADEQMQRQTALEKGKSDLQVDKKYSKEREKEEGEKEKEKEKGKEEEKEEEKEEKEKGKEEKEKGKEREKDEESKKKVKDTELMQGRKRMQEKDPEERKTNEQSRGTGQKAGPESAMEEQSQNCVENKNSNSKTKEEDEDEEDSSMFDELMEQVHKNDPSVSEINVNNSEVIKTKTLIQFAEALHGNTHIKAFALANCRADDHVAYAIAGALRANKTLTSINLDSNHLTGKGIIALIRALQHNATLTELRFHNQRHICGGKTEMEMTKVLKENTTLLKLGYQFELAGPRMTMTNILSRNMDRQRQRRLQEQKLAQANGDKKGTLEVPKTGGVGSLKGSPMPSPKPSPLASPMPSPKLTPKRTSRGGGPPPPPPPPGGGPPPPPPPPAPLLDMDSLKNSLTPVSQRRVEGKVGGAAGGRNSRDQLLASIRDSTKMKLKKVAVPKLLQ